MLERIRLVNTVTEVSKPQAIYKRWLREGDKVSINLKDYDYVIVYYYKSSGEQSQ